MADLYVCSAVDCGQSYPTAERYVEHTELTGHGERMEDVLAGLSEPGAAAIVGVLGAVAAARAKGSRRR